MKRPMTLAQWAEAGFPEDTNLVMRVSSSSSPSLFQNVRKLHRLGLLTDEVTFSLVGQAPVDPIGLFGALKARGAVWAFNALDATLVSVLANSKNGPLAAMRVDLLSDDVTFVAKQNDQLVAHHVLTAAEVMAKLREPGMTEEDMLAWFDTHAKETIEAAKTQ